MITSLHLESVRCLRALALDPAPSLNLIVGENGSGKTTVLESVHLLSTGRSFRTQRLRELLQRGADSMLVRAGVLTPGAIPSDGHPPIESGNSIGLQFRAGRSRLRKDGEDVRSIAEFARLLPVVVVTPDSMRLLTDGSNLRRKLVDWSLFHVESAYQGVHARYRRALQHRNALLRSAMPSEDLDAWTSELAKYGTELNYFRMQHMPSVLDTLRRSVANVCRVHVDVEFSPGWDGDFALETALGNAQRTDFARGFTTVGPHRADLAFRVHGAPAQNVLSRGESKIFVVGLILGQAHHLAERTAQRAVVLFDELASDLDNRARASVFGAIDDLGSQSWVSAVSEDLVTSAGVTAACRFELEDLTRM